jgi:alcohol dehydrogenase (cytochrome c)/quinohemoprotein ethanol dehydrogenase
VDAARLTAADSDNRNWMSHGRTYDEQRFSPLTQITPQTVSQLGLAWHHDLDTAHRAQESTPLVIDGVMYVTSAWSKVFALDARTGKQLWAYDPQVPGAVGVNACCDVVNRGVAAWKGKLYLGTLDGRLVALDAATGKQKWEVLTVPENSRYTITGAPRVIKDKVFIGNGGSEVGVRGYLSAYDADTGKLIWRFYTVPADPSQAADGAASDKPLQEIAAKTWTGDWWKLGGGGTVWDSMTYDSQLDLLYIGVGNGSPWNRALRSPGGGDNLFLASIVALRPDTGEYVWHYQTTPGESWDFTATQHMILADLEHDGRKRPVLMQAPKNGFFYLLDRATGELLSAKGFATMNWARGVDLKTGRPIENPDARYGETGKPWVSIPGPGGAHSWQPMSFSPLTKLVYIPVMDAAFPFIPERKFEVKKLAWNTGVDFDAGSLPQDPAIKAQAKGGLKGYLSAWDPQAQREVWRVQYSTPWNGGVLATAGNLVFQGNAMGELAAFQADTGARLWSAETQAGVLAPPISYEVDGEQYIALEVGWGGAFGLAAGELARDAHIASNTPRVLAFKLNGRDVLPAQAAQAAQPPPQRSLAASERAQPLPARKASTATLAHGKAVFHRYCGVCHGDSAVSGGVLPDLRHSQALVQPEVWQSIVHDGALQTRGMVAFGAELSKQDVEDVRRYVMQRAQDSNL